jgi:hypothetical protein
MPGNNSFTDATLTNTCLKGTLKLSPYSYSSVSGLATQNYVDDKISSLVGTAPATLNTLQEIATSLGNDPTLYTDVMTGLNSKAPKDSPTFTGTVNGISKGMVGLESVDNTSDTNKPVSSATQTALDLKANSSALNNYLTTANATANYAPKMTVGLAFNNVSLNNAGVVGEMYLDTYSNPYTLHLRIATNASSSSWKTITLA